MSGFVWLVLIIYIVLNVLIFSRFCNLGMIKGRAVIRTFKFQYEIFRIHYILFKQNQKEDLKVALLLLIYPITNLPNAIVSYAEMYINRDAFEFAFKELLIELSESEKQEMIESLVEKGVITIKRKKIYSDEDIDVIKQYGPLERILI